MKIRSWKPPEENHLGSYEIFHQDGEYIATALNKTDADLIAAAPDLLEALKNLHAFNSVKNLTRAYEVIAKAEGKS